MDMVIYNLVCYSAATFTSASADDQIPSIIRIKVGVEEGIV